MPAEAPMAVAMTPTSSDCRAPKTMRERMQRPNWSVPRGNSVEGLASAWGRSCWIGSWGATCRAASATRESATMTPRPISASRCRAKRRHSFIANARVEPAIEDVHEQIDQDEHDGDEQHAALHDRVVTLEDGRDGKAPHTRPREDGLGDDGAAQEKAVLEPDHRDHGDQRVLEGVLAHHAPGRDALGARRRHVLAPEHVSMPERVSRLMMASDVVASVAAGNTMWRRPSHSHTGPARPDTGSQPSCRLKSQMATMATQKIGMESVESEAPMAR